MNVIRTWCFVSLNHFKEVTPIHLVDVHNAYEISIINTHLPPENSTIHRQEMGEADSKPQASEAEPDPKSN